MHRNVAAARLDRLVAGGLLAASYARRTGRRGPGAGRPGKLYHVLPELEAIAYPKRPFERLVGRLLDELPRRDRRRRLRRVGEELGNELASTAGLKRMRTLPAGLEQLCRAVSSLGFQTTLLEAAAKRAVLATPTCPLRPLVADWPDAAEIDRGMWSALVEASVRGARAVACETAGCGDGARPCTIEIRLG